MIAALRKLIITLDRRPDPYEWAMGVALAVSARGECVRRRVGAVITDTEGRIVAAGYNGAAPGARSCLDGACPRGQHMRRSGYADTECPGYQWGAECRGDCTGRGHPGVLRDGICVCGAPWPCARAVEPGSSYATGPGACISVHAELNALLDVSDRSRLMGAEMWVTAKPCDACLRIIWNTRIERVTYLDDEGVARIASRPAR